MFLDPNHDILLPQSNPPKTQRSRGIHSIAYTVLHAGIACSLRAAIHLEWIRHPIMNLPCNFPVPNSPHISFSFSLFFFFAPGYKVARFSPASGNTGHIERRKGRGALAGRRNVMNEKKYKSRNKYRRRRAFVVRMEEGKRTTPVMAWMGIRLSWSASQRGYGRAELASGDGPRERAKGKGASRTMMLSLCSAPSSTRRAACNVENPCTHAK